MHFKETEDIHRLYRREWVTMHTVSENVVIDHEHNPEPAYPVVQQGQQWLRDNLLGRVREQDIRLVAHIDDPSPADGQTVLIWVDVQVFKENLKGEFKYPTGASGYAEEQGYDEYVVVVRNSKQDHQIRSYGVTKL